MAGQSVGAGLRTAAYTHTLATGETGPFTFTLSASVKAAGTISAYTGVDTSTPVDVTGGSVNPAGTSHTIPSVTTTGANRLLVSVLGAATITTTDYTGTSETKRGEQAAASGTPTVTIADGDVALAVAGATGTKTVTTTNSAASAGLTVTLRPVATAGAVTANRTYTIGGAPVAMRTSTTTGSSSVSWLLDNQQGSIIGMVQADTGVAATINRYLPYGGRRGTDQLTATDRGYIGQTEDPSTALVYLNARYYDPNLARFTRVDPIASLARPQSINPYSYAENDPTNGSDPSGLCLECAIMADLAGGGARGAGSAISTGPSSTPPRLGCGGPNMSATCLPPAPTSNTGCGGSNISAICNTKPRGPSSTKNPNPPVGPCMNVLSIGTGVLGCFGGGGSTGFGTGGTSSGTNPFGNGCSLGAGVLAACTPDGTARPKITTATESGDDDSGWAQGIADHLKGRPLNGVPPGAEAQYIEDVLTGKRIAEERDLRGSRTGYWDPINENVIIKDPMSQDGGTAFYRPNGYDWFMEELQ